MRRIFTIIIILFLIFSFFNISLTSKTLKDNSKIKNCNIIYVDDDNVLGPWNGTINYPYKKINNAIENLTFGQDIFVFNGTYNEILTIEKQVKIQGENKFSTIIDGFYKSNIIEIRVENVRISNFTIRNSAGYKDNAGLLINNGNNSIDNCIFYNTKTALFFHKSDNNKIDNCTFSTNGEAILLEKSNHNLIIGCKISKNAIGINIDNSKNNNIKYCYFDTNGISFLSNYSDNMKILHSNISDNSVNIGGIFLVNCTNVLLDNSNLIHNGVGICLFSCENIEIRNSNFILNTHYAISLRTPSYNVKISKCNVLKNFRFGIYIEKGNDCIISENNIYQNNLYGLNSKNAKVNAINNWWGTKYGPALSGIRKSDKITWLPFKTKYFPWSKNLFQDNGPNWNENKEYMNKKDPNIPEKIIKLEGNDEDNDLIPDWWEEKWGYNKSVWDDHANLDPDNDALNNIEECYTDKWNSNPFIKDIFLELDWMECPYPEDTNKPSQFFIDKLIKIFFEHDINLHMDLGMLGGGEQIPFCENHFSFSKLRDMYWQYFLHDNITNPRKGIFHYGVICNYCPDLNFPFFGFSDFDSFAISSKWLKELNPLYEKDQLIVGGVVHHLGHTLGLLADTHGGIDNLEASNPLSVQFWKYYNYKSCMHYLYKYNIFTYSDGSNGKGDFNDWDNLNFSFFKETSFKNK